MNKQTLFAEAQNRGWAWIEHNGMFFVGPVIIDHTIHVMGVATTLEGAVKHAIEDHTEDKCQKTS